MRLVTIICAKARYEVLGSTNNALNYAHMVIVMQLSQWPCKTLCDIVPSPESSSGIDIYGVKQNIE